MLNKDIRKRELIPVLLRLMCVTYCTFLSFFFKNNKTSPHAPHLQTTTMASLTTDEAPRTPILNRLKLERKDSIKLNRDRLHKLKLQVETSADPTKSDVSAEVSFASPRSLVTHEVTHGDVTFASPKSLVQVTDDNNTASPGSPVPLSAISPHTPAVKSNLNLTAVSNNSVSGVTNSVGINSDSSSDNNNKPAEATPKQVNTLPKHVRDLASKITSTTDSMKLNRKRMCRTTVAASSNEASAEDVAKLPPHVRDLASKLKSTTDSMKLNKKRVSTTKKQ